MELKPIQVDLDNLLLDPNNYRFRDLRSYAWVDPQRYHEEAVQRRADDYMRDEHAFGVPSLRDSIFRNGYITLDRIVVRAYAEEEGKYVVVEGNRRIAAVRWLREQHVRGIVTLEQATYESLASIDALELEGADENAERVIMAIRHVAGIKEWGPYQQARLIVELIDAGEDVATISQKLGMEAREVTRRYRASRALAQMEGDEDYGDYAAADMYATFQEFISRPTLRTWLGWSDTEGRFENEEVRNQLYEWLSPAESESGEHRDPKIRSWAQARLLWRVVESEQALGLLADPERTFEEAYAAATKEPKSENALSELDYALKRVSTAIANLPAALLADLDDPRLELMDAVSQAIADQLAMREKLIGE